ncbi:MAG TPA: choice-of-anchor B family protein [Ignavibacteria bacterium]|jgi:choice-of-anchor B domain-containing protein
MKIIFYKASLIMFVLCGLSFSQSSSNMRPLANIDNHNIDGLYSACWGYTDSIGNEYAILGCPKGTAFINITDTNNIREAAYVPGLLSCCREMKTFGHYVYVVADGISSGLQIIDLKYLPDSARLVNTFFFPGFTRGHTISQEGPYLYIHAGDYSNDGLFILDITDPINPVKRGEWETAVVHDSRVRHDTIWACNIYNPPGTISVIDARDKDNLVTITSWVNGQNPGPHNIAISSNRRFAFVTDEIGGNPRTLKIWDITNLNDVRFVTTWQPNGITTSIIHNVELFDSYLFAAHYTAGLRVVDVSNPAVPLEAAFYDTYPQNNGFTYDGCWGTYIFPSEKIICSDRSTGLYVFKTSFSLSTHPPIVPEDFYLKQNYPNPFNPSTSIEFGLPYDGFASIKVYDALGKEVALVFDSFVSKGVQTVLFDSKNFASGVYFYSMNVSYSVNGVTKTYSAAKKMILAK